MMYNFKAITIFLIFTSALLTICGCNEQQAALEKPHSQIVSLSTPERMIRSLEKLPPVEKVTPWKNGYDNGITITTKHYNIHTTMLEPLMLQRVPGFMESAYRSYQQQLPIPIQTQNKFTIYIFGTRDQWEQFTREFTGQNAETYLKIQKGAYYLNGACVTYNIGRSKTFSVLGHEGWHQFSGRHFAYRLPSWLDEGMATHFESSNYKNGFFYFDPSKNLGRLGSLRKVLQADNTIPLEKLLTLNPGQVVAHADFDAVMAFYAQSYALIRFLKEDDYGRNLKNFQSLLLDARQGEWPLDEKLSRIASDRNIPLTTEWNKFISPRLFDYYIEDHTKMQERYTSFCIKIARAVRFKRTTEIIHK